ncbi:MAG: chemotaxis protein CheX, partial [Desulfatirhabdiaceae bacterium]
INQLDLKSFAGNSTRDVFDTMLSMKMDPVAIETEGMILGSKVVGTVSFAGEVMGNICIHVTDLFARTMAAAMLGMEPDEMEDEDEVNDVIGEVSNMIGGDLKSRLCDAGFPCQLSIPSITRGSDFRIESMGWARHEQVAFQNQGQIALIEVFIKSVK